MSAKALRCVTRDRMFASRRARAAYPCCTRPAAVPTHRPARSCAQNYGTRPAQLPTPSSHHTTVEERALAIR
eukprot:4136662-Prymnesium_polylepis.1